VDLENAKRGFGGYLGNGSAKNEHIK